MRKVAALFQNAREQQPAAFAAGEMLDQAADAIVGEQEALQVCAHGEPCLAPHDQLGAVAHFLQRGAIFAQLQAVLIDVVELRELPDFDRAFGWFQLADDRPEQRRFAEAIAPGDADALAVLEGEIETAKQSSVRRAAMPRLLHSTTRLPSCGGGGMQSSTSSSTAGAAWLSTS